MFLANVRAHGGYLSVAEEPSPHPLSASYLLSAPSSPHTQQRRELFAATLDFVEALCEASTNLTRFQQVREGRR